MRTNLICALFAIFVAWLATPTQAATVTSSGVTDLLVGSQTYNVTFSNGKCSDLFGGCNELSDFPFATSATTLQAMNALRDAVNASSLVNSPGGFDGCSNSSTCYIFSPNGGNFVQDNFTLSWLLVRNSGSLQVASGCCFGSSFDTTGTTIYTWATWSVVPVPVPSSMALLPAGLLGLALIRRRKRRKETA